MTQYNHEMVFSDAELTMIEAALVRIHAYSKDQVTNGAGPPICRTEIVAKIF